MQISLLGLTGETNKTKYLNQKEFEIKNWIVLKEIPKGGRNQLFPNVILCW